VDACACSTWFSLAPVPINISLHTCQRNGQAKPHILSVVETDAKCTCARSRNTIHRLFRSSPPTLFTSTLSSFILLMIPYIRPLVISFRLTRSLVSSDVKAICFLAFSWVIRRDLPVLVIAVTPLSPLLRANDCYWSVLKGFRIGICRRQVKKDFRCRILKGQMGKGEEPRMIGRHQSFITMIVEEVSFHSSFCFL